MTRSLVIGINGTIGAALFSYLKSNGNVAWGTSRRASIHDPQIIPFNFTDPTSLQTLPPDFDTAYVCAGICRMALCEDDPVSSRQINITGTLQLLERMTKQGTFIVYLSTNQVFAGTTPWMACDAAQNPINEYGRQKAEVEQWLQTNCSHYAIVRLTKVVEPQMALIAGWIAQLQRGETLSAFTDMPLAPVSLRQVIELLEIIGRNKHTGIYHISGSEDMSYFEVACYLAQQLHCSTHLVQPAQAIEHGIKKIFLPQFTSLNCSSTINIAAFKPPAVSDVIHECFTI